VGIRFHGGTPGRKKNIESFRIYARKRMGLSTINAEAVLGKPYNVDFKTLVFKYTFQSLRTQDIHFNPFVHSLALEVASRIGAIAPRFHLVDLTINKQKKGLFLAMEHLSRRTIEHWLKSDKFSTYSYKSHNSQEQAFPVFSIAKSILSAKGEESLVVLKKHMDLNNVLNSILLSAYIGDDDYCQGIEVITHNNNTQKLTSINWDLDHAFFSLENDQPFIDPDKYGFRPIALKKSSCVRQWMYGWTYIQSTRFRLLLRQRMETLLDTVLSEENAVKLLDYYKQLNQAEFSGKYSAPIAELEAFMLRRPDILRKQLTEMENNVQNITPAEIHSWDQETVGLSKFCSKQPSPTAS
jgi:hypothetical protein